MTKTKKIILFIFEGITEEAALAGIFTKLIKNNRVKFYFTSGDITSDNATKPSNLKRKLGEHVKCFLEKNYLKKSNIKSVIHLLDTDGAYIDEKFIEKDNNCENFYYMTTCIKAKKVLEVIERNKRKSNLMEILLNMNKVLSTVDYKAYYLSSNLEHVLHNKINVPKCEKMKLAEKFDDMYYGKEIEFIDFISNSSIAVSGNHKETWNYIKKDLNSLNRFSNLHLFFQENQNSY